MPIYHQRLTDLSWFFKCLNQPIARQANKEDNCTGHFFESRFKSQALTTEAALIACLAYVDLNPVRAGMADKPETSEHTSIKTRLHPEINLTQAIQNRWEGTDILNIDLPKSVPIKPLTPFDGATSHLHQQGIPIAFSDYLCLVDYTGRAIRDNKRGHIPRQLPSILERLNFDQKEWLQQCQHFEAIHAANCRKKQKIPIAA